MKIYTNFSNPLDISRGKHLDHVQVKFHESGMRFFVSTESGKQLEMSDIKESQSRQAMPKMLPKGVNH